MSLCIKSVLINCEIALYDKAEMVIVIVFPQNVAYYAVNISTGVCELFHPAFILRTMLWRSVYRSTATQNMASFHFNSH